MDSLNEKSLLIAQQMRQHSQCAKSKNLKKHIESVPEGIKPFKCSSYYFKTASKSTLKKHIESVHEGIKPFKCNKCGFENTKKI